MQLSLNIHKQLRDFKLQIQVEESENRIGILGASGCGKSMTLKCIAGIETPDEGRISFNHQVFYDHDKHVDVAAQKRRVGYLFQNYALFPTMTVAENIACGIASGGFAGKQKKRIQKAEKKKIVERMVERFHLKGLEGQYPDRLSGGQQQRVALARLMAYEPEMILLDEPFSAMDSHLRDQLQNQLSEMLEGFQGTMILVSHNRDEIYRFCDRLLVMEEGKVIVLGNTKDVFQNPETKEAARLTGCKNYTGIHRIDDYTCRLIDWGITIHTKRKIPEDAKYLGYRAHDFIPVWDRKETAAPCEDGHGCGLRFELARTADMPFEKYYYLIPQGSRSLENPEFISWFVQEKTFDEIQRNGDPLYLRMEEEKMLFLK